MKKFLAVLLTMAMLLTMVPGAYAGDLEQEEGQEIQETQQPAETSPTEDPAAETEEPAAPAEGTPETEDSAAEADQTPETEEPQLNEETGEPEDQTSEPAEVSSEVGTTSDGGAEAPAAAEALDTVYVSGSGSDSNNGKTADTAVATLAKAYELLAAEGGTIMVCGTVAMDAAADVSGTDAANGKVTITGDTDGTLKYTTKDTNQIFGKETVIENLAIEMPTAKKSPVTFYSNESLTIGKNVTVSTPANFQIYGGSPSANPDLADSDIKIAVNSGDIQAIWACGKQAVNSVTIDLGGTANVLSHVRCGGQSAAESVTLNVEVEGKSYSAGNAIYLGAKTDSSAIVDAININLKTGILKKKGICVDTEVPDTAKNIHVTIHPDFEFSLNDTGKYGYKLTGTETNTLTLPGWNGTLPDGMLASYDTITLTENSAITCEDVTELANKAITVESGSALDLTNACTEAEAKEANITITGAGTVTYKTEGGGSEVEAPHDLDVVYVNSSLETSGDGKTADTAVRTLVEAYDLIKTDGGTIVVCGAMTVDGKLATKMLDHPVTGEVTITGSYGGTDYGAAITVQNASTISYLMFGPRTTLEHISFQEEGDGKVSLYSNRSLTLGEGFSCDAAGKKIYSVYADCPSKDYSQYDITLTLLSGTYNQVFMGQNHGPVGKIYFTQGGTATVLSNVTLGNGSKDESVGGIDLTMNGGYTKVIYDTPRANGHSGDVTLRLNGGSITEFRDYNKLADGTVNADMGNITVYLSPDFAFTGSIGVWTDGHLTTGRKALVMTGYAGINPPKGAENYDVVNLVGGGTVPAGLDVSPAVEDSTKLLQIADYQGDLSIGLDGFDKLNVSHNSDIRYLGTFPQGMALDVAEGSVLRLSAASNSEVPKYTGNGTVELVMPEYSDPDMVLSVNFDGRDVQDLSGKGNDGAVYGSPACVESYDGSKALYLSNKYGEAAQNYVLFEDLKGVDLTRDNYTVSFWMRTENGGADEWYGSGDAVNPGSGLAMNRNKIGGVLFANTDAKDGTAPGFAAAQLHGKQYLTLAMTDANGSQKATDGSRQTADGLWYMVTVTVDRNGSYQLYINDTLISAVSIAGMKGQALGQNVLSLGADALGQYGIGCAYFDDLAVYSRALSAVDVQANYCLGALKLVLQEMEARLADAGEEYTDEARDELRAALKEGLREAAGLTAEDYLEAQALEAELRTALEDFLMSPEANLTLLLISDIHIGNQTDTRANKLRRLFADREESGIAMDGILQAGDFGDDSSEKKSNDAFDVMAECFGNHAEWQMIGCTGNHETEYTDESENYMVSSKIYWQRMQDYVSEDGSQKYGGGVLDSVWQQELTGTDGKTYTGAPSFGLTFKDYHFVVLNSDNPGQYKNLKDLTNPTVEEALAADPIRHGAWFSKETQSWLDNQMAAYAKDGKPIFVVCHFPFIDTVPLSYFDPIPINDNSIGRQDAEVRNILAKYDNVLYFCGHLHSNMGVNNVVTVEAANGGSFTEINLPTLNSSARGYADMPATWYMYVYDTEIVLRGRDALNSKWLTGYDIVIPLGGVELNRTELTLDIGESEALKATITAAGANEKTVTWSSSDESVATVDENGVVTAVGRGEAIITVTAGSYSASCTVEVQRRPYIPVPPTQPTKPAEPDEPDTPDEPDVSDEPDTPDVPASDYADVQEDAWYAEAVDYVTAEGLMTGTTADAFAPDVTTTRAMIWTILGRMSGASVSGGEPWYALAQSWAVSSGVSDGSDPDSKITREQLAAMLYRYAGEPELLDSELAGLSGYADHGDVSSYAYRAMAWAVSRGIINGLDGSLAPQGFATRAQVAAMLMRYCQNLVK